VLHPLPAETYSAPLGEPAQASADCGTIGNRPAAVAPTPTDTQLALLFGVISDTNALDEYAMQVSDPSSPLYHHYLTSAQIAAMFGPSECNSKALIAWAQSHGLSTEEDVSGFVDVGGTIAQLNEALNVTFENYQRYDGSIYYAPDRQPSIDSSVPLLGVSGLDNCYLPIPANADQPEGQPDAGSAGSANM
jgi:kumamolisin